MASLQQYEPACIQYGINIYNTDCQLKKDTVYNMNLRSLCVSSYAQNKSYNMVVNRFHFICMQLICFHATLSCSKMKGGIVTFENLPHHYLRCKHKTPRVFLN